MKNNNKKVMTPPNKNKEENKKRKILMATLIPVGVLAATAAIVTPTVIACKTKNSTIEAVFDNDSHWITKEMKFEAGKQYTIEADIDVEKVGGSPATISFHDHTKFEVVSFTKNGTPYTYYEHDGEYISLDAFAENSKLQIVLKPKSTSTTTCWFSL